MRLNNRIFLDPQKTYFFYLTINNEKRLFKKNI